MPHYHGSCQCGAVRFTVDMSLDGAVTCNCSRCQRLGSVFAFAPHASFTLLAGEENLTEFLFHRQVIRHQFCKVCGIEGFAYGTTPDGSAIVAVNVNVLDGVDPRALNTTHYDGKAV